MWFLALCLLFFLGAVATFTWRSVLVKYQFIFAKEHFIEFAQALNELKKSQLDEYAAKLPDQSTEALAEGQGTAPPHLLTSAGLALVYSVQPHGAQTNHHLSLSYRGQPIAYAAATTFLAFAARLLGLPPERITVTRSPRGLYHAHLVMTGPEHAAFREREVEIPYADQVREIQKECNEVRARCWPQQRVEPQQGEPSGGLGR